MNNNYLEYRYYMGVVCFLTCLFLGVVNDVIVKLLNPNIAAQEIIFFKYVFGTISLLPLIAYFRISLKTRYIFLHALRGLILNLAFFLWIKGLLLSHIALATMINFTTPLFLLILNLVFLNEKVNWHRFTGTIIGFAGIIIAIGCGIDGLNLKYLFLFGATFFFALLDVINKQYLVKEPFIVTLFYSSLFTFLFSVPGTVEYWTIPVQSDLLILFLLGISANLLLFFLLKAFSLADATALSPYRYLELMFSLILGYLIFNEMPVKNTYYGLSLILSSIGFIFYFERQNQQKLKAKILS
ncbi:DMT family transporter [Anaplasmataceae bacterium AB001_6]|nr:DMT family transporter [Anaplasmataceae bacterium AB001_6]